MGLGIPPLDIEIVLESNPLKSNLTTEIGRRSRFNHFDFDAVWYFGFDIASILRAQSVCWTELAVA